MPSLQAVASPRVTWLLLAVACSTGRAPSKDESTGGASSAGPAATAGSAPAGSGGSSAGTGTGGAGAKGGSTATAGSSAAGGATGVSGAGGSGAAGAGGAAGAPAGGRGAAAGAGGATATSGASGSMGGNAATAGAAGTAASGGAGTAGSGTAGSGTAGAGAFDCKSLPLCDDFETGSTPSSATWTTIPSGASGASIDAIGAHGSGHSLKIVSSDRLYLRNGSAIGTLGAVAYVHFYVRFAMTLAQGHGAMVVTHPTAVDQYSQSNELRFGSQDMVFHWNTDSDAANVPDVSPNGDAASFRPMANTWYCVNLLIDTSGRLGVSIDGADQPGLTVDGMPTANIDQAWLASSASLMRYTALADFNVGWDSYGAGAMTMWYDDVALSTAPLPCP